MSIYQAVMAVPEYFLFDPKGEYLDPPLQGHHLREGKYVRIEMVEGRLPSEVIGLHLERDEEWLRFYNPVSGRWLPTQEEREAALEAERERLASELKVSGMELERLRKELEEWRRRFGERSREPPLRGE
jgi:hypothetical protein